MDDIFDLVCHDAIIRQEMRKKGQIRLSDYQFEPVKGDYEERWLTLEGRNWKEMQSQMKEQLGFVEDAINEMGLDRGFYTACVEATLNAYQHGNKHDPEKPIVVNVRQNEGLEVVVEDAGGVIDSEFPVFVAALRQNKKGYLNFYKFTQRQNPEVNMGTGTSFMHMYADEVGYGVSRFGGLAVMIKKRV